MTGASAGMSPRVMIGDWLVKSIPMGCGMILPSWRPAMGPRAPHGRSKLSVLPAAPPTDIVLYLMEAADTTSCNLTGDFFQCCVSGIGELPTPEGIIGDADMINDQRPTVSTPYCALPSWWRPPRPAGTPSAQLDTEMSRRGDGASANPQSTPRSLDGLLLELGVWDGGAWHGGDTRKDKLDSSPKAVGGGRTRPREEEDARDIVRPCVATSSTWREPLLATAAGSATSAPTTTTAPRGLGGWWTNIRSSWPLDAQAGT